ncbi:hypothetical protein [Futiania mangrovi]|uniref:Uncharacterized protein n=1 Tax=Futiania mangrovi TaxID=2959716 RepID=A0A9J6PDR9_9PROT|nr:hypothetical protein [Futiania mangrovii]MCP1337557.1 hypothetical protein [Futiania mangrovii]
MTGIANASAFSGFDAPGGDDFSLDLAGPDAAGAPAPSEPEGGTEVAIFPWFGRRGPDYQRNNGGGNGNDGVGGPGNPGDACADLARQMSIKSNNILTFIRLADQYASNGHPGLARDALIKAKNMIVDMQAACSEFAQRCQGSPAVPESDQVRLGLACRDLADVEKEIDKRLVSLSQGNAFDLGGLAQTAGAVFGQVLQILGGIGRALSGPQWQN